MVAQTLQDRLSQFARLASLRGAQISGLQQQQQQHNDIGIQAAASEDDTKEDNDNITSEGMEEIMNDFLTVAVNNVDFKEKLSCSDSPSKCPSSPLEQALALDLDLEAIKQNSPSPLRPQNSRFQEYTQYLLEVGNGMTMKEVTWMKSIKCAKEFLSTNPGELFLEYLQVEEEKKQKKEEEEKNSSAVPATSKAIDSWLEKVEAWSQFPACGRMIPQRSGGGPSSVSSRWLTGLCDRLGDKGENPKENWPFKKYIFMKIIAGITPLCICN